MEASHSLCNRQSWHVGFTKARKLIDNDTMITLCHAFIYPYKCYHHADLSEGAELLNACQIYSVSSVCLRLGQFSQLSFMQYMGLCVFSFPIFLMMIVRIPVLDPIIIIMKSEI